MFKRLILCQLTILVAALASLPVSQAQSIAKPDRDEDRRPHPMRTHFGGPPAPGPDEFPRKFHMLCPRARRCGLMRTHLSGFGVRARSPPMA